MSRAQQGRSTAQDELFARYYERVRGIVRRRLGNGLRELLESGDIVQETFALAIPAFRRFEMRDPASVVKWLSRIAEHAIKGAIDRGFAGKRRPPAGRLIREGGSEEVHLLDRDADPAEYISRREQLERVRRSLAALPAAYRRVIVLRNYRQLSWGRIAKLTGRPTGDAARMMHGRALRELRRRLGGGGASGPRRR